MTKYRRNARQITWPVCVARYPDGTVIRMSVKSEDGSPPYDLGKRVCDLAYASTVYRRDNNVTMAGHSICSLEFHDEVAFCRSFKCDGARYEIVNHGEQPEPIEPVRPKTTQRAMRRSRFDMPALVSFVK